MTFLMTAQLTSERYLLKIVPPFVTAHTFCASRRVVRDIRGFLRNLATDTTVFSRDLSLSGKSRSRVSEFKKKIRGNNAVFRVN